MGRGRGMGMGYGQFGLTHGIAKTAVIAEDMVEITKGNAVNATIRNIASYILKINFHFFINFLLKSSSLHNIFGF
jgi:hypothetical protein